MGGALIGFQQAQNFQTADFRKLQIQQHNEIPPARQIIRHPALPKIDQGFRSIAGDAD